MPSLAVPRTWTGANTNWNDGANWGGAAPGDGDAVVVPNTGTKPSMASGTYPASGAFLSFEVQAGAIVTCLGNTSVVNEASGGTTNLPHGTGVAINCQSALINGTLSADAQGFNKMGGYGGPGWGSSGYGRGGTYGGIGSKNNTTSSYGSLKQPTALGSDGHTDPGGGPAGGGAIRVNVTGTLTLNGIISANGGPSTYMGAGSGGSLWLTCVTFQGNGVVGADGGGKSSGLYVGGGSGGRVAIEYTSSTFSGAVSVAGGVGPTPSQTGQPGTLWEPKRFPNAVSNVVITNSYQYFFPSTASDYNWGLTLTSGAAVYFHDFTNGILTFTNLLVTGASTLRFDVDSTSAIGKTGIDNLALSNSTIVSGASRLYGADCRGSVTSLVVSGGSICDFSICTNTFSLLLGVVVTNAGSYLNFGTRMGLPALGSILMDTNTTLYLPAQTYSLAGDLNIPAGAVLYARGNTNDINVASGGTTNKSHGSGVRINCMNALINGILNADMQGFNGAIGFGGPGWAGPPGSWYSGGTYGGRGGKNATNSYGSLQSPTALGSDGHTDAGGGPMGGGAIRVNATGTLTLNGLISANGGPSTGTGAGSGGSLWLACNTFQGNGAIQANGGGNSSGTYVGSGAGGRVALEYNSSTFSGVVSMAPGSAPTVNQTGLTGTLFQCVSPWTGMTTTNGVNGRRLDTQFSVSSNNVKIARSITRFDTSLQWSDYSTDTSGSIVVSNNAAYTISGLRPGRGYSVYFDGTNQFGGQLFTSTNGILTFTNTLNILRNFLVTPAERGTIFTVY